MTETKNTSFLREYGGRLLSLGYPIVPIKPGLKHPGFKGWRKVKATEKQLTRWLTNGFAYGGVGVQARDFPGCDVDVKDPEITELLVKWCDEHIGPTVQRVGEAPKTLLVFRTSQPFSKITSRKYRDFIGIEHKLEILGDGQQFVAYAVHPDTGIPYEWVSEKSLADVSPEELPEINAGKAQALVEYFESIVPDDWEEFEHESKSSPIDYSLSDEERVLLYTKPKLNVSREKLTRAVNMLDPDMRMIEWVRVGMGLFHQFEGDQTGFSIWDEWSSQGTKYNAGEMKNRWRSFLADLRKEPVTAATIISKAKEAYKEKKQQEQNERGFKLVHAKDILAKLGPIDWQVKGYIEADTTGLLFGDPGSYKSFLALDIGIHCALGRDWHDSPVKQGPVIYVAGEGHGGFARRLAAFQKAHDITLDDVPLFFSQQAASLYNEESALQVTDAIDAIAKVSARPVMVIIDTLARNLGAGDENSTADMNVFIDNVDQLIRAKYNCTVMVVHHTGHSNKQRARGASTVHGAIDFEYRVEKPEGQTGYVAKLVCTKMKDAMEPQDVWFEGESITVGKFEDDDMTSLVFRKSAASVQEENPLKGKQKACYELLQDATQDGQGIEKKAFQQMLIDAEISENNNQARVLVNELIKKEYLIEFEGVLRVTDVFS